MYMANPSENDTSVNMSLSTLQYFQKLLYYIYSLQPKQRNEMYNGSHNKIVRYMEKMYLYDFYFKIITTDQNAYNSMEKKIS